MVDRDSAERAVKDANPIIDGRKANVNLAYLGAKPRNGFLQNGSLSSCSSYSQPLCIMLFVLLLLVTSLKQNRSSADLQCVK